jgi:acetate kinase
MLNVLTINGGSSSIRFAIFEAGQPPRRLMQGKMERIGGAGASLTVDHGAVKGPAHIDIESKDRAQPLDS